MHSFIPLEVSVGRRRVRRRSSMSSMSSISSRRRTATGRDDRPARSSAVMGLSRRACLSLSRAMSLSRDVSLSLARARAPSTARPRPPLRPRTRPRTRARIHERTNARIHPCIHSCIHASSVPTLRRRRGWISRDARRETSSRDVVARLETRAREERERGERCRSPNRATEDDDGRTATPRRRFDSIRFRHLILI